MSVAKGLRAVARSPSVKNAVTADTLTAVGYSPTTLDTSETAARKLSAVDRCIEILSDSMAKLPTYCVDRVTRERVELPLLRLLNIRPNEAMAPSVPEKATGGQPPDPGEQLRLDPAQLLYGRDHRADPFARRACLYLAGHRRTGMAQCPGPGVWKRVYSIPCRCEPLFRAAAASVRAGMFAVLLGVVGAVFCIYPCF